MDKLIFLIWHYPAHGYSSFTLNEFKHVLLENNLFMTRPNPRNKFRKNIKDCVQIHSFIQIVFGRFFNRFDALDSKKYLFFKLNLLYFMLQNFKQSAFTSLPNVYFFK